MTAELNNKTTAGFTRDQEQFLLEDCITLKSYFEGRRIYISQTLLDKLDLAALLYYQATNRVTLESEDGYVFPSEFFIGFSRLLGHWQREFDASGEYCNNSDAFVNASRGGMRLTMFDYEISNTTPATAAAYARFRRAADEMRNMCGLPRYQRAYLDRKKGKLTNVAAEYPRWLLDSLSGIKRIQ